MSRDRVVRGALWVAVVLNGIGVLVFAPPALGLAPERLPIPAPRFYAGQIAVTIALFGGVFAWLARQAQINRAVVVVGALGKLGFFTLVAAYWAAGDLPASAVLQAAPDLLLAIVFLWWAWSARMRPRAAVGAAGIRRGGAGNDLARDDR